jgi:hypothetical protein
MQTQNKRVWRDKRVWRGASFFPRKRRQANRKPANCSLLQQFVVITLTLAGWNFFPARAAILPDETSIEVTYYVNSSASNASDSNSGAASSPFKSFRQGLYAAYKSNKRAKVYVYNGTYTEASQISLSDQPDKTKLIVIEGQTAGSVKITAPNVTSSLIYATPDKQNIVLRNLVFDGCKGTGFEIGRWEPVSSARYVLIENCQFINGGGTGLTINTTRDVTIRNTRFHNNAGVGAFLAVRDANISDCEFNNNQTAGKGSSDYFGGLCFAGSNVQFTRIKCNGNKGRGLRMDHAAQDVTFNDCEFNNNLATGTDQGLGMQWEIAQGPVTFTNCRINGNQRGVQLETAQGFTFDRCTFSDNSEAAINITWKKRDALHGSSNTWSAGGGGTLYRDPGQNWTYQFVLDGTRRTTIKNSTITTTKGSSSMLIRKRPEDTGYYDYANWYRDEYSGSNNTFFNGNNTGVFEIQNGNTNTGTYTNFAGWKSATGSDGDSRWSSATGTNLVANPSFDAENYDTQTPSGWSETSYYGDSGAGYTESNGGSASGARHATHWSGVRYSIYTWQTKTGLQNGLYTLRCKARRGSGQIACQLEAKDYGGSIKTATLPVSSTYQTVEIKDINVTNGTCTIGIWSDAYAHNWAHFDDFEFFKQ